MEHSDVNRAKRIYRFFYLVRVQQALWTGLMSPFWVVFFKTMGLSYSDISLLIVVSYVSTLIFEIPTGTIADLWGRKLSVILSLIVTGSTCIGIFFFPSSFELLLLFYALQGIGATLSSGAFSAWLADSLIAVGEEENLTEYWGGITSSNYLGSVLGFLIGGGLASLGLFRDIWLISGLGAFATVLFIAFLGKETPVISSDSSESAKNTFKAYIRTLREGSIYLFSFTLLFWLTVASFFWYISTGVLSLGWQPYLVEHGIPIPVLSAILIAYTLLAFFVTNKAGMLTNWIGGERLLLGAIALVGGGLTFLMIPAKDLAWLVFIIYGGIISLKEPTFYGYINRFIPSNLRATVLSSYSMVTSISTILSMFIFGKASDNWGLNIAIAFSATVMVIAATVLFIIAYQRYDEKAYI